jgi:hypothetical protein
MNALLRPFRSLRRLARHLLIAREDVAARARMACLVPADGNATRIRLQRDGDWIVVRTLGQDLQPQDVHVHQSLVDPLIAALRATRREAA